MDIMFIRHGETEDNIQKIYSRDTTGLSEKGILEAKKAKKIVDDLDFQAVYYSPLIRARETLEHLGLKGVEEPRIREMDFGIFTGHTYREIVEKYPKESREWLEHGNSYVIPQGESLELVYERLTDFLNELVKRDKNTLLVTHEGIIRLACCWVFDNVDYFYRFKASNGSLTTITIVDGYKYISKLNLV